jgi:small conductance mechanosensitive channel
MEMMSVAFASEFNLEIFDQFLRQLAALAPRILLGFVVFFAFWIASVMFRSIVFKLHWPIPGDILKLVGQAGGIALLVLGGVTGLGTMGINITALVAGLGLTGFALGFAFKDILGNLLAGVLLLIYRPFHLKDFISVSGFEGTVVDIDLRYTTLHGEGKTILIPNSVLFTNSIVILEQPTRSPQ